MDRFALNDSLAPVLTELREIRKLLEKIKANSPPRCLVCGSSGNFHFMGCSAAPDYSKMFPNAPKLPVPDLGPVTGCTCGQCGTWVPFNTAHACVRF